jgi:hypothetical protein
MPPRAAGTARSHELEITTVNGVLFTATDFRNSQDGIHPSAMDVADGVSIQAGIEQPITAG